MNKLVVLFSILALQNVGKCNSDESINNSKSKDYTHTVQSANFNDSIKIVKSFKKIVFKINNNDKSCIGYESVLEDESIGVKAILIDGNFVYLTDVFHGNIKKIDLASGSLISSTTLGNSRRNMWIRDIGLFNNLIYAPNDLDSVYVLSTELRYLKNFPIQEGRKFIEDITLDGLNIFLSDKQLDNKKIKKELLHIDKNGNKTQFSKIVPFNSYLQNSSQNQIRGKIYKTYLKNGKKYFQSQFGTIEINENIPHIKAYDAYNLDFTPNALVFFNSTPEEFTLFIYNY